MKYEDKITLYCKGAGWYIINTYLPKIHLNLFSDSVVLARLGSGSDRLKRTTLGHLAVRVCVCMCVFYIVIYLMLN